MMVSVPLIGISLHWRSRNVVSLFAVLGSLAVLTAAEAPPIVFTDITQPAGIAFVHHNGAAGNKWYPELFGGGVAVLDIDGDGWPDLLFVNATEWRPSGMRSRCRLYRHNPYGTLREVSSGRGLDAVDGYPVRWSVGD